MNPQYQAVPHQMTETPLQHSKNLSGPFECSVGPAGKHTSPSSLQNGYRLTSDREPSKGSQAPPVGGNAESTPTGIASPVAESPAAGRAISPPHARVITLLVITLDDQRRRGWDLRLDILTIAEPQTHMVLNDRVWEFRVDDDIGRLVVAAQTIWSSPISWTV